MKKIIALFCLSVSCACAQMQTINLGAAGKITLYLLGDWKVAEASMANQFTLNLEPAKSDANVSGKIEVTLPETDRFETKARLKLRVEADGRAYAEESVEGKAVAREFSLNVPGAYGFFCTFTDSSLRGKPSQPGNYKVVMAGKIRLSPNVLVNVFVGADAFREEAYQQLLGAIEGMEFTPGRGR